MQLYYVLSLAHSPVGNHALFWGKNACGYTQDITQAGVFLEDTIKEDPGYYNNGKTTRAIKKEEVEQIATLSVQWSDVQGFR